MHICPKLREANKCVDPGFDVDWGNAMKSAGHSGYGGLQHVITNYSGHPVQLHENSHPAFYSQLRIAQRGAAVCPGFERWVICVRAVECYASAAAGYLLFADCKCHIRFARSAGFAQTTGFLHNVWVTLLIF